MRKYIPKFSAIIVWLVLGQFVFSNLAFAATAIATTPTSPGLPQDELNALNKNPNYVQNYNTCTTSPSTTGGTTSAPSGNQTQIAQIIIGIAKTENLGQAGAIIGLMAGLDESGLQIYANSNVPISLTNPATQAVGHDGDSVGVFQQQPQYSWSTIATGQAALSNQAAVFQDMDPAFSAEAFFGSPPGANLSGLAVPSALTKGLQNISGWQNLQPWVAAQKVQASGDPTGANYQKEFTQAQALVNQLYTSSAPVALPVPLSGGSPSSAPSGTSATGTSGCYTTGVNATGAANANAQTQAIIQAGIQEIAKNIPYAYGGGGPNGPSIGGDGLSGFDCSSFMQYIFWQGAQMRIGRTTGAQYAETVGAGHSVQLANIQPGDLIFYGPSASNTEHVVMYIGNNMIIQAPSTGHNLDEIPLFTNGIVGIGFYPPIGG